MWPHFQCCLSVWCGCSIFTIREERLEQGFKCNSQKLDTLFLLIPIGQILVTWPNLSDTQIGNAEKCGLDSGHPCNKLRREGSWGKEVVFVIAIIYWAFFTSINFQDPSRGSGIVQELINSCWIEETEDSRAPKGAQKNQNYQLISLLCDVFQPSVSFCKMKMVDPLVSRRAILNLTAVN